VRRIGATVCVAATLAAAVPVVSAETYVIGDSLTRQTYTEGDGWHVDARDGRALQTAVPRIIGRALLHPAAAIVVALGSNDVSRRSITMVADLAAIVASSAGIAEVQGTHCLVVTTVKVKGVTRFYAGGKWSTWAQRWNRAVWSSGAHVAHWRPLAEAHPRWFLGDGLHLTPAGERAYDRLLRRSVEEHCPAPPEEPVDVIPSTPSATSPPERSAPPPDDSPASSGGSVVPGTGGSVVPGTVDAVGPVVDHIADTVAQTGTALVRSADVLGTRR